MSRHYQGLVELKPLVKAILIENDRGRAYPSEALRWLCSSVIARAGGKDHEPPHKGREALVDTLVEHYRQAVADTAPLTDLLGPLYMELASCGHKQYLGQFFTPQPVAQMMAAMTLGDIPEGPPREGPFHTMCDPACGSGVMLLAAADQVRRTHGPAALEDWSFSGNDLDTTCALMIGAQLVANAHIHQLNFGEIAITRGNALSADPVEVIVHGTHLPLEEIAQRRKAEVIPINHPRRRAALAHAARVKQSQDAGQVEMFDLPELEAPPRRRAGGMAP